MSVCVCTSERAWSGKGAGVVGGEILLCISETKCVFKAVRFENIREPSCVSSQGQVLLSNLL